MARPPSGPDGTRIPRGRRADPVLAALLAEPFRIHRPAGQTVPFVFASPHSGRLYPDSLVAESRLDALDACAAPKTPSSTSCSPASPALGAPLIAARFPRAYCDVNRAAERTRRRHVRRRAGRCRSMRPAPRVAAGLGVIPRIVRDGAEIYRGKLSPREARAAADAALPALSRGAGGAGRGNPRALRRGGRGGLPFHAVGAVGARHRARRPLWRLGAAAADRLGGERFRGARFFDWRATRPMPAATPPCSMAAARAGCPCAADRNQSRALSRRRPHRSASPASMRLQKRLTEALARLTAIDPSLLGGRALPLAAE